MGIAANRAYIRVTYEALKEMLALPENATIRCVENNMNDVLYVHEIRVLVEHPDLPRIPARGESPPHFSIECVDGKLTHKEWGT